MAEKKQSKYTKAQKLAYYSGMGYATAYSGKAINFKEESNRDSFRAGYKRGSAMIKAAPNKYPSLDDVKAKKTPSTKKAVAAKGSKAKKSSSTKKEK